MLRKLNHRDTENTEKKFIKRLFGQALLIAKVTTERSSCRRLKLMISLLVCETCSLKVKV